MSPQLDSTYLALADALPSGLIIHDHEYILFANRAAARMFAADQSVGLAGRPWTSLVHSSCLRDAQRRVTQVLAGQPQSAGEEVASRTLVRLDGTTFEASVTRTGSSWGGRPCVQAVVRDVTAERTVEQALAESETLREQILHAMPGGIVRVRADGSILSANDEACRVLGLSWDELQQRYTFDFDSETVHADGSPCPVEEYPVSHALATGRPQPPKTIGVRRPDGRVSWAVFTAVPTIDGDTTVGAVVTLLDITERFDAEAAAEARASQQNVLSELGLRALVEDHLDALFDDAVQRIVQTLEVPHAHVLEWDSGRRRLRNVAGRGRLAEVDLDELAGISEVSGLGPEAPDANPSEPWFPERPDVERWPTGELRVTARLASIIHGRLAPYGVIVAQTDEPRCFRRDDQAFLDGLANLLAAAVERRRIERRRIELEAQLRQQQKLDSVGTLASGVAHEINNPIQGIMSYAELIRTSATPASRHAEWAEQIVQGTERIAVIVRNLLAFARPEAAGRRRTSLRSLVNRTLSLVRTVLRKDQITLEVDVPDSLPQLECQAQQIQQVLMNLVVNARDALNARWPGYNREKVVRVEAARFEREGKPWVRLIIEDAGVGIPEDTLDRVFDPFFTTKRGDRGTGLGLSVSHKIVVEHGGRLWAESRPGSTRLHVELPVESSS